MISGIYPRAYHKYVSLPLFGPVVEEFADWLRQKGYRDSTIKYQLSVVPHVEAFFARRGAQRLDDLTCDDFEAAWSAFCHERRCAASTPRLIKRFLMESHGLKPVVPESLTPICRELDRFGNHMRDVRGLAGSTIRGYIPSESSWSTWALTTVPVCSRISPSNRSTAIWSSGLSDFSEGRLGTSFRS